MWEVAWKINIWPTGSKLISIGGREHTQFRFVPFNTKTAMSSVYDIAIKEMSKRTISDQPSIEQVSGDAMHEMSELFKKKKKAFIPKDTDGLEDVDVESIIQAVKPGTPGKYQKNHIQENSTHTRRSLSTKKSSLGLFSPSRMQNERGEDIPMPLNGELDEECDAGEEF